jgi:hypothetical protein
VTQDSGERSADMFLQTKLISDGVYDPKVAT